MTSVVAVTGRGGIRPGALLKVDAARFSPRRRGGVWHFNSRPTRPRGGVGTAQTREGSLERILRVAEPPLPSRSLVRWARAGAGRREGAAAWSASCCTPTAVERARSPAHTGGVTVAGKPRPGSHSSPPPGALIFFLPFNTSATCLRLFSSAYRAPGPCGAAAVGVRNGCLDLPAGCLRAACRCSAA
eukprot:COSAG06_NODE_1303_length_9931_cov_69.878255_8_plen_187_part_00